MSFIKSNTIPSSTLTESSRVFMCFKFIGFHLRALIRFCSFAVTVESLLDKDIFRELESVVKNS